MKRQSRISILQTTCLLLATTFAACAGPDMVDGEPPAGDDISTSSSPLSTGGNVVWRQITPATNPPSSSNARLVFDSANRVATLFHPEDGAMWTWDGFDWTRVPWPDVDASPGDRMTTMVYDTARERMVVMGGFNCANGCGRTSDTWEWFGSPSDWVRRLDVGAPGYGRNSHSLVYDEGREVTVLTGGLFGGGGMEDSDTWEYDGTSWTEILGPGAGYTPARQGHATAYDSHRGVVVLFGGGDITGGTRYSDLWEYDGTSWEQRTAPGLWPAARHSHSMTFDPVRNVTIVFSGEGLYAYDYQWEWDGTSWTRAALGAENPGGRNRHTMVFDPDRKRVVLFGGWDSVPQGDTWEMYVRGNACTSTDDCHTGFCVDGVCCETACDGVCEACSADKKGGGENGVCEPVNAGLDPDDECTAGSGNDAVCMPGTCNGAGACTINEGTTCEDAFCSDAVSVTPAATCDAAGTCQPATPESCGLYACETNACLSECVNDSDCAPTGICKSGSCLERCNETADCSGDLVCVDNACIPPCTDDAQCPGTEICVAGICGPECVTDVDCPGTEICTAGVCEPECVTDVDCPGTEICTDGVCGPECVTDVDCPGTEICTAGVCGPECVTDVDCPGTEICTAGVCGPECATDVDCPGTEICTAGVCGPECVTDVDCAGTEICTDGVCGPECATDVDCPGTEICTAGVCGPECAADVDCPGTEICTAGVCGPECVTNADCMGTEVCFAGVCEEPSPECVTDDDCSDGLQCRDGVCDEPAPECVADGDCESDERCVSNVCVEKEPEGRLVWAGGGCSSVPGTTGSTGSAAALLLVAMGLWRRRSHTAAVSVPSLVRVGAFGLFAAIALVVSPAQAQVQEGFDANRYQAPPLATDGLFIQRPTTLKKGGFGASLTFSYAHSPLVQKRLSPDGTVLEEIPVIDDQLFGHVALAYGVLDPLSLYLSLPVALYQQGDGLSGVGPTALGDLRFGGRFHFLGAPAGSGLAVDAAVIFPTGNSRAFSSDGGFRFQAALLGELLPISALYLSGTAGLQIRPEVEALGAGWAPDLHVTAGGGFRTEDDGIRAGVEASLYARLENVAAARTFGAETLGLVSLRLIGGLHASLGAGVGFADGIGTPDFRAVARVGWGEPRRATTPAPDPVPEPVEPPPAVVAVHTPEPEPEPVAQPEPEPVAPPTVAVAQVSLDRDGDGILDSADACPDTPRIAYTQSSRNGCPEGWGEIQDIEEHLHFVFGRAEITPASAPFLDTVARKLKEFPYGKVIVEGHTDSIGTEEFNLRLSRDRAQAVVDALVARGVAASRLEARGHGFVRAIADNESEEGRAKNRRVEFRLP